MCITKFTLYTSCHILKNSILQNLKMWDENDFGVMIQIKTKRNLLINTSRACYRKTWVYM